MKSKNRLFICLVLLSSLCACFVPERFNATITVKPDSNYVYKFDGVVTHAIALIGKGQAGHFSTQEEATIKADVLEQTSKARGVKKITYKGGARFELTLEEELKLGQTSDVIPVLNVSRKDEVISIAPIELSPKGKVELDKLGLTVRGTLKVFLPDNAQVISHNAKSTPNLFSKAYTWNVGAIDQRPMLQFRLIDRTIK